MQSFASVDWAVVAVYFGLLFAIVWLTRSKRDDAEAYFLAGRDVGWFVVGASIFASNIGSEHLVGLAGAGAASGVAVAQFEILAGFILLLLGWLFVPFYVASGAFTMPEFMEKRYSAGPRFYLAGVSIVGYVLTKISVTIAAGAIVFETLMGIDFWTGAGITVVVTGLYTLWGGLRAVVFTEVVQTVILIGGAILVTVLGLQAVGGWEGLRAAIEPQSFSMWKPSSHPDYPWTGILFGAPVLAVWYWCTDQYIVQRALAAKSIKHARRGAIAAGYLKQLPLFIFVLPGLAAFALAQQGALTLGEADQALPALVREILPVGARGLVAAALLAALMSSLASAFNSCATLIAVDVVKRLRPATTDKTLVLTGRVGVAAMVAFGLAWIPFMDVISGQLFTYIQSVQAYIAPPIAAVFLLGVLWPRASSAGAIACLAFGAIAGLARLSLEIMGVKGVFVETNFLHFAAILFVLSCAVHVAVSLVTKAPDPVRIRGLVIGQGPPEAAEGRGLDLVLSVGLIVLIVIVWAAFSPLMFGAAR